MAQDKNQRSGSGKQRRDTKAPILDLKAEEVKPAPQDADKPAASEKAPADKATPSEPAAATSPAATSTPDPKKPEKTEPAKQADNAKQVDNAEPKAAAQKSTAAGSSRQSATGSTKAKPASDNKPASGTSGGGDGATGGGRAGPPSGGGRATGRGGSPWMFAGALAIILAAIVAGAWLYRDYGGTLFPFIGPGGDRVGALERTVRENSQTLWANNQQLEETRNRLDTVAQEAANAKGEAQVARTGLDKVQSEAAEALATVNRLRDDLQTPAQEGESAGAERVASLALELNELSRRVGALAGEVEAARSAGQNVEALSQRVGELEGAVEAIRAEQAARARKAADVAGAIGALREAVAAGRPFAGELNTVSSLMSDTDAVSALQQYAEQGVATSAALATEFDKVSRALSTPDTSSPAPAEDAGLWDRLASRIDSVVQVRPSEAVDWEDVAGRMAPLVQAGDIAGAVRIAESASGGPPEALAAWLDRARGRLAADEAVATLTDTALARLSALNVPPTE